MKIAIGVSGGKDSTALLVWALENSDEEIIPIFADTGWEHPLTYEYLDYLEDELGVKIIRLHSRKYKDLLDLIRKKKIFPSPRIRICTYELKIKPLAEFLRENNIDQYWSGVRRDESSARKIRYVNVNAERCYPAYKFSHEYRKSEKICFRYPILEWSKRDVLNFLKQHNIKLNPIYSMGFDRVGCYPCVLSLKEMRLVAVKDEIGKERVQALLDLQEKLREQGLNVRIAIDKKKNEYIPNFLTQTTLQEASE